MSGLASTRLFMCIIAASVTLAGCQSTEPRETATRIQPSPRPLAQSGSAGDARDPAPIAPGRAAVAANQFEGQTADGQERRIPAAVAQAAGREGTIVSVSDPVRSSADQYSFTYEVVVSTSGGGEREMTIREDGAVLRSIESGTIEP